MPEPSSPFRPRRSERGEVSPAALKGLLERAREERFKLMSAVNDARRATGQMAPAAPVATPDARAAEALAEASRTSAQLIDALNGVNERLRERHEQLAYAETRLAARLDVLEAETARKVEAEVGRRVEAVVIDAERRLAAVAGAMAQRLGVSLNGGPAPGPRLVEDVA